MYLQKGLKELGQLENLLIVSSSCSEEEYLPFVAAVDREGKAKEWLFDSFLMVTHASSGNAFAADVNLGTSMASEGDFYAVPFPNPAKKNDWEESIEGMIRGSKTLSQTVSRVEAELGKPSHKRNIVICQPYPGILQSLFGVLNGKQMNFSTLNQNLDKASRDRLTACKWYVDLLLKRWEEEGIDNLNLLGFYVTFETVDRGWDVDDHWVLKEYKKHVNSKGLKTFWIPFWATYNTHLLDDYQRYYFDAAFYQPNYMFYVSRTGVGDCAMEAEKRNAGFEMEYYIKLNEPIKVDSERHQRFRGYLDGGVDYGYMKAACAWFLGGATPENFVYDPEERGIYEDIVEFVHERYQKPGDKK